MRETRRVLAGPALPTPIGIAATALFSAAVVVLLHAAALAAPTVFVYPSELMVEPGETFSMSIRVDAGTDTVTCFLAEFTFSADVLELAEASEGSLFSMCGYGTMYNWDQIESGVHSCNDVTLGHEAHVLPPGELVDLEFHAGAPGVTWIQITTIDLRDMQRNPILPVNTERALVCVVEATEVGEHSQVDKGSLLSVHPNPCRGAASLSWSAPADKGRAALSIYDVRGRLVWHRNLDGESGTQLWDGRTKDGTRARAGTYFVELRVGDESTREKLVLLR